VSRLLHLGDHVEEGRSTGVAGHQSTGSKNTQGDLRNDDTRDGRTGLGKGGGAKVDDISVPRTDGRGVVRSFLDSNGDRKDDDCGSACAFETWGGERTGRENRDDSDPSERLDSAERLDRADESGRDSRDGDEDGRAGTVGRKGVEGHTHAEHTRAGSENHDWGE
jgi:hypothetical protein